MATRTDRLMSAAVRAARHAKRWADRLLQEARKQIASEDRRSGLKQTLLKTGRVLMVAGRVALVAAVAAGIAEARSGRRGRRLPRRGRGR